MAHLDFPFTLRYVLQDEGEELSTVVNSRAMLIDEIAHVGNIDRAQADTLADKIVMGQEVNAGEHNLRFYGTKDSSPKSAKQ